MNEIFVFGSNLAGRHGAGSAREAYIYYGARYGVGFGRTGNAYAIPTKDRQLKRLPLEEIKPHVDEFLAYARHNSAQVFWIVDIGCGLAGYSPKEIAPLFRGASDNCVFIGALDALVIRLGG